MLKDIFKKSQAKNETQIVMHSPGALNLGLPDWMWGFVPYSRRRGEALLQFRLPATIGIHGILTLYQLDHLIFYKEETQDLLS